MYSQARRCVQLKNLIIDITIFLIKILFEIFDIVVASIVAYGAEIWGFKKRNEIEAVKLTFCKYVLGIGSQTPNIAVLGECGRFLLSIIYSTKCIKYWLKLVSIEAPELTKSCYNMSLQMCDAGKINWVFFVKNMLYKYGFSFAFLNQGVGDKKQFISLFKQRLKDNHLQEWNSRLSINEISRLQCYSKSKYRVALTKFHCSNHSLNAELGRLMIKVSPITCDFVNSVLF